MLKIHARYKKEFSRQLLLPMFSLIITIISIALVAALALATLYYGGTAFNQGRAKADAAKLLTQTQQLLGAADMFIAREGRVPNGTAELVSLGYLKSAPQAAYAVQHAVADVASWDMPAPGVHAVFILPRTSTDTCRAFNASVMGMDGISPTAHEDYAAQCFGARPDHKVVVARSAPMLALAAGASPGLFDTSEFVSAPLPAVEDEEAWIVVPGSLVGRGPGTPGNPGEGGSEGPEAPGEGSSIVALESSDAQNLFVAANGGSAYGAVTFQNTGDAPATLNFSGLSAPFSVSPSTCTAPAAVSGVAGTCSVLVGLNYDGAVGDLPSQTLVATGADSGSVSVPVGGSARGSVAQLVSAPSLTLAPAAYGQWTGETAGQFTIRNAGNESMTLDNVLLDFPYSFANGCVEVAPGETCDIALRWDWVYTTPGTHNATLSFGGATQGNRADLTVSGVLQGSMAEVTRSFYTEANYSAANAGRPVDTIEVRNTGNVPMTLDFSSDNGLFYPSPHNCTNVQPNATCNLSISMDTNWYYAGGYEQSAVIYVNGASVYAQFYGSGRTLATESTWEHTGVMDFGTGLVGTQTTRTRVLFNQGNKAWTPTTVYNLPANVTSNLTQACGTLAAKASCTVTFTYSRNMVSTGNWSATDIWAGPNDFGNAFPMSGGAQ